MVDSLLGNTGVCVFIFVWAGGPGGIKFVLKLHSETFYSGSKSQVGPKRLEYITKHSTICTLDHGRCQVSVSCE